MKKRILCLAFACLLAVCTFVLFSCDIKEEASCEHTYSDVWTSDATHHWHAASCEHADEISAKAEHDWDEGSVTTEPTETADGVKTFTCKVCQKTKTESIVALGHTHTYANTLSYDQNGHYYAATCGHADQKKDYTAHETTSAVTAPTCTEAGYTTNTCACGYSYISEPVAVLGHAWQIGAQGANGKHPVVCGNNSAHVSVLDCSYASSVTDPTCTEAGYTTHTCACGHSYTDTPVEALQHDWQIGGVGANGKHTLVCTHNAEHTVEENCSYTSNVTVPTCTEAGFTTHTCACGYSYTDTPVEALQHDWQISGLGANGKHALVCSRDHTHTDEVNCSYTDSITAPTCTEAGFTTHTCACGYSYTDTPVEALQHDWQIDESDGNGKHTLVCANDPAHTDEVSCSYTDRVTAPTCTEAGFTTHTCACGYSYTDTPVEALQHDWQLGAQGENGKHTLVCANDATHTVEEECEYTSRVTAPTCTEAGFTTHTCACGHSYTGSPVPALQHDWQIGESDGNGKHTLVCSRDHTHTDEVNCSYTDSVTAPTCTEAGFTTHTCACGYSYTDTPVEALQHDWQVGESNSDGTHALVCSRDETHTSVGECSYTDSRVTAPTCTEAGFTTHTCACGHFYTDTPVEALQHDWQLGESNGDGSHTMVCTRDNTHTEDRDCSYESSVTAAGCTTAGYTTYTCVCGYSYTDDETEATGHAFNTAEWASNDAYHWHEATCAHDTERKDYAAHSYSIFVETKVATCTEAGYTTYKCACGKTEKRDVVDALGHNYGEFQEKSRLLIKEDCCQYAVTYVAVCDACGGTEQKIENTEFHNFYYEKEKNASCTVTGVNAICQPTCATQGIQHKHCANPECRYYTDCADVIYYEDADAHVWNDGEQKTNVITYTCTVKDCGKSKNTAVVTDGNTADISGGEVDEVAIGQTTINMNEEMKNTLTEKNDSVSITAGVTEDENAKKALLEQYGFSLEDIGSQPIYSFTVTGADEEDFGEGGMATITIPYNLGENDDRNNIVVFYISNGKLTALEADYYEQDGQGYATFRTEHFSDYVPASVKPEELCALFGEHSDDRHVVAATCTTEGYTVCLRCNEIIEKTPALGHKWISEITLANSCEQNGIMHYACAECALAYDSILPATGHYHVMTAYVAASCRNDGHFDFACIYCDDVYTVTEPQLPHQYISKSVAPTCEARGYTQKTCMLCADVQTAYVPALGHSFGEGFEKGEEGHYHTCTVCGARGAVEKHEPGEAATEEHPQLCEICDYVIAPQLTHQHKNMTQYSCVEPTCTQNGHVEYFVCACGKWFLDEQATKLVSDHASVVLLALGHTNEDIPYQAPTCTEAGHTAGVKCSVCQTLIRGNVIIAATGHDYVQVVTAPTCEQGGYTTHTCTGCADSYTDNVTEALGHRYSRVVLAPTCEQDGYTTYTCQKCAHVYTDNVTEALGHSFSAVWMTNATAHWHECARCQFVKDEAEHVKNYEQATEEHGINCTVCGYEVEAIKNHTHVVKRAYEAVEPSCEIAGNKAYFVCGCGEWFYDEDCTQLITDRTDVIIPASGHDLVRGEAVAPTCQSFGHSAGYSCKNCSFKGGRMEIAPLPHRYEELCFDEDNHWYKCVSCDKTNAVEAHEYKEIVIEPTCEVGGYTVYICDCGYEYIGDQQLATGHSFDKMICNNDGTHTFVCGADPKHQKVVRCEYSDTAVIAPTCDTQGYTERTCKCGYMTKAQYVPATGHRYGDWTSEGNGKHTHVCANDATHVETKDCTYVGVVTDPDCENAGYTTYTCSGCSDSYVGDETEALGHDYEAVVTDPTCTEGGYTTYTCSVCGDSYVGDETNPLPHEYEAVVTDPTCTEGGYTTYTCSVCGDSYVGDETEALGHDYEAVVTDPTCTEGGYTTYTCSVCGDSYVGDETNPLPHEYEAVVTDPDCENAGYTTYTCSVCGDSYVGDETEALGHSFVDGVCEHCGMSNAPSYNINTIFVSTTYDEKTGNAVVTLAVMNADLAGIHLTLNHGNYECIGLNLPDAAMAYDVNGAVNYVFSGGENTTTEYVMLLEMQLASNGKPIDLDQISLNLYDIFRFADDGGLEVPEYAIVFAK